MKNVKLSGSMLFAATIALVFLLALIAATGFGSGAWLYPVVLAVPSLVIALLQLNVEIHGGKKNERILDVESDHSLPVDIYYKRSAKYAGWILVLFAFIWLIGFKIALVLFFVLFLRIEGHRRWLNIAVLTGVMLVVLVQYEQIFGVEWPEGYFEPYIDRYIFEPLYPNKIREFWGF